MPGPGSEPGLSSSTAPPAPLLSPAGKEVRGSSLLRHPVHRVREDGEPGAEALKAALFQVF